MRFFSDTLSTFSLLLSLSLSLSQPGEVTPCVQCDTELSPPTPCITPLPPAGPTLSRHPGAQPASPPPLERKLAKLKSLYILSPIHSNSTIYSYVITLHEITCKNE